MGARISRIMGANSVQEASRIGKCLKLCELLGIEEFDYTGLAEAVDLRASLDLSECLITHTAKPQNFVILKRDKSYMSPMVEIEGEVIWAFDKKAESYASKPKILLGEEVFMLPYKMG